MLGVPIVPFAKPIRKVWRKDLEKASRLEINDVDEDSELSDESFASSSSDGIDEEIENDGTEFDSFQSNIDYLLANPLLLSTNTQYWVEPPKIREGESAFSRFRRKYLKNPVSVFLRWRAAERKRRMHYIIREYEQKVVEYDKMLKAKIQEEIEADERAVLIEAHKTAERIKKSLIKKKNKLAVTKKFQEDLRRRDEEEQRMAFNAEYLPKWAVERRNEKLEAKAKLERDRIEEDRRLRLAKVNDSIVAMKAADAIIYQQDLDISNDVLRIMRCSGIVSGVNAGKSFIPKPTFGSENLVIELIENVDFNRSLSKKLAYPFDQDISARATELKSLKARGIGERGGLCLGAEFVRTHLPMLETLDLSFCELKSRGLSRLLRGIKLSKLNSLETLILRGNHLTPKSLEYIKDLFESDVFCNLKVLDLQDNELGDSCADTIIRLVMMGCFEHIREVRLQNNGIGDLGFSKMVKVLQSIYSSKCPSLERLGLERNNVSPDCKRSLAPFPPCLSV